MKQITGTIKAIATRCRNGGKWNEITIDIDGKGEEEYVHKLPIRDMKEYADARGVAQVQDLVGMPIILEFADAKAS